MTTLQQMNQKEVISWIQSLPTDESFTSTVKQEIINGIVETAKQEGSAVTGQDFYDSESADDIIELCGISSKKKARGLLRKISAKKQADFNKKQKQKGAQPGAPSAPSCESFTLNIQAIRSNMYKIKNVTKLTTVATVKSRFMAELGDEAGANEFKGKLSQWNKSSGKIELKKSGKNMVNDRTLESYGIVNGMHLPLVVSFKVIGGAYYDSKSDDKEDDDKEDDDDDDDDGDDEQFRVRKLRRKKHKGYIKFTSKPDCIMDYTDADGITRAEMPCGCAFAADTMYRYMKSIFEKDYKTTKAICPMPKKQCKGNDKQRLWPWALVFIIADLSENEVMKYTKAIENRISGSKNCPHCGAVTERPDNLRISRVRCTVCNKSDWCWNCSKVWNHGGLGPICGNKNCMGEEINIVLQNCGEITAPSQWSDIKNKGKNIPMTRACPKCLSPLEYTQACKHIWCICCPHEFCFNCLGDWKSGECSHSKICDFTKVQVFT